jgi:hypothetical protein
MLLTTVMEHHGLTELEDGIQSQKVFELMKVGSVEEGICHVCSYVTPFS